MIYNILLTFLLLFFINVSAQTLYISPVRFASKCNDDEIYYDCGYGCKRTCANVTNESSSSETELTPFIILDKPCNFSCVSGCFCKSPLLRNRFGQCVPRKKCNLAYKRDELIIDLDHFFKTLTTNNKPENGGEIRVDNQKTSFNTFFSQFDLEKNIFDDLFGTSKIVYSNEKKSNNFDINDSDGKIQANYNNLSNNKNILELEDLIEKEADTIIKELNQSFRWKKIVKNILRDLINESKYIQPNFSNEKKDDNRGLINTKLIDKK